MSLICCRCHPKQAFTLVRFPSYIVSLSLFVILIFLLALKVQVSIDSTERMADGLTDSKFPILMKKLVEVLPTAGTYCGSYTWAYPSTPSLGSGQSPQNPPGGFENFNFFPRKLINFFLTSYLFFLISQGSPGGFEGCFSRVPLTCFRVTSPGISGILAKCSRNEFSGIISARFQVINVKGSEILQ